MDLNQLKFFNTKKMKEKQWYNNGNVVYSWVLTKENACLYSSRYSLGKNSQLKPIAIFREKINISDSRVALNLLFNLTKF